MANCAVPFVSMENIWHLMKLWLWVGWITPQYVIFVCSPPLAPYAKWTDAITKIIAIPKLVWNFIVVVAFLCMFLTTLRPSLSLYHPFSSHRLKSNCDGEKKKKHSISRRSTLFFDYRKFSIILGLFLSVIDQQIEFVRFARHINSRISMTIEWIIFTRKKNYWWEQYGMLWIQYHNYDCGRCNPLDGSQTRWTTDGNGCVRCLSTHIRATLTDAAESPWLRTGFNFYQQFLNFIVFIHLKRSNHVNRMHLRIMISKQFSFRIGPPNVNRTSSFTAPSTGRKLY